LHTFTRLTVFCLLAPLAVTTHAAAEPEGASGLTAAFDDNGLHSLQFAGEEFVQDGAFHVSHAVMRRWDGGTAAADLKAGRRAFDPEKRRLQISYPWGEVRCTYNPEADRLRLTIDLTNQSDSVLTEFTAEIMQTRFPQPPKGWQPHYPQRSFNLGSPTTLFAACEHTTVAACNEDVGRPLQFGWAGRESLSQRPLIVATVSDWMGEMLNPMLSRPLYPGQSDRFELSLRFAAAGAPDEQLAGDLWKRFAEVHPYRLKWDDRRPIGALFLSSSGLGAEKNPRGWLNEKAADFVSEAGRQAFRERVLAYAQQSVKVLQGMDCQGMITWDIEGQEYPHATSYLGDPRSLPPEMEPVADAYFKTFTDAGLRVGICIRPQLPVRTAYGDGVRQLEAADAEANLDAKIEYGKKRWGCTLFYIDSNGDPNVPMPAEWFCRLAAKHPDCLLMPEHENPQYYTGTAPYRCYANLKQLGTPDYVRRLYPDAFCALYIGHGDPEPVKEQLVQDVKRGDILVVHGWYSPDNHKVVQWIYDQAGK